jgi:hypothetical protein
VTDHGPSRRRAGLAVLAGAATAAFGALILGEYEFNGATPYLAGVLFGLIVAEVVLTVAKRASRALAATSALEAGFGLAWAVWISSGRGRAPIPFAADVSVALGVLVAAGWVVIPTRNRSRATPAASSPDPDGA